MTTRALNPADSFPASSPLSAISYEEAERDLRTVLDPVDDPFPDRDSKYIFALDHYIDKNGLFNTRLVWARDDGG
jgi:hypothetical protein